MWLKDGHQVNLRIDFDNKICEIVNTACRSFFIYNNVMTDLQNMLNEISLTFSFSISAFLHSIFQPPVLIE